MTAIYSFNPGSVLTRHLASIATLRADEQAAIGAVTSVPGRSVKARSDLAREGEPPQGVLLIHSGWACRYKMLEDGRRQIVAFLIPGDLCDLNNAVLDRMDHSIGALTAVGYAALSHDRLSRLSIEHPQIGKALWRQALVNVATQREWTINIGQRNAAERIGSLFCELMLRLQAVGLAGKTTFDFPLSQIHIAEATGLTPVHVNRTIRHLRSADMIEWTGRVVTIPDFKRLQLASLFEPNYLHLDDEYPYGDRSTGAGPGK